MFKNLLDVLTNGIYVRYVIDKISFTKVNCDLSIRRTLLKYPENKNINKSDYAI